MHYNATSWEPVPDSSVMALNWLRYLAVFGMIAFFTIGVATIWVSFDALLPYWGATAIIWGVSGTIAGKIRGATRAHRLRAM